MSAFKPETVDFHQLDTCEHCGGTLDHWKTTTEWLDRRDGSMVYRCEWICQKCGAVSDRYEDGRGYEMDGRNMHWTGE
jgi:hypothetical protein